MKHFSYTKLITGVLAAWFAIVVVASALHLLQTEAGRPPLPLLFAVAAPILVFFAWYRTSSGFRDFVMGVNPTILTLVQSWRVAGFVFLVLYAYRILPGVFAIPAGWGDILIGATAPVAALRLARPGRRGMFLLWQFLGMADLVMAVSLGAAAQFMQSAIHGGALEVTTAPMTVLPLSLIPAFAVPLLLILHIACIAQVQRWPAHRENAPSIA